MSLINEAFKELKGIDLDEELFSFDEKGARDLSYFLDDTSDPVLDVVDPLATDEEELQPNYEGNVICQCCVCKQLIYKKPEDIVIDEETQNVNVGEECPHCYNTRGFKVIGQVEPYFDKDEVKVTVDDDEVAVEEDETEEVVESLNEERPVRTTRSKSNAPYYHAIKRALGVSDKTADSILSLYVQYSPDAFDEYPDPKDFEEFVKDDVFDLLDWAEDYRLPHVDEIRAAIEFKESINESWEDAYEQFTDIIDHSMGDPDQIEKQVDALYAKHKGEKDWDFAYSKWMETADDDTLTEDTVKQGNKWVNKGKEGTHGTFRTKKAADAQRKAMYASGYRGESLKERLNPEDATIIILEIHSQEMDDFLYTSEDKANAHFDSLSKNKGLLGYAYLRREGDDKFYRADWKANKNYTSKVDKDIQKYLDKVNGVEKESLKEDLDPSIVAKMDKNSFINYVTTRKGWTTEEAEDYLKTYFDEALDEKLTIEVTEEDINHFDEDTGDVIVDKAKFVGKDVQKGDYVTLKFTDENEDADTQDYKFVEETEDGFKLEWIGAKELHEDFQKATVETGSSILSMESDDSGKVTVTSEPRKAEEGGDETIAPVSDEVMAEIEDNNSEETEEEETTEEETTEEDTSEGEGEEEASEEEEEVSVDEFEESYFNDLGKKYLQEVYNNVTSYETTKGSIDGKKIKLEGIISFKSGKRAKTEFFFEGYSVTKAGKVKFLGENAQITGKKNAFTLTGSVNKGKLFAESLTYNYRAKDAVTGKTVREYGTVKR